MGQWSRGPNEPPFIDLVPPEEAEGERQALYGELERVRGPGRVSNLFRAYSAFPALGMANFRRLVVLLTQGRLSVKFKEGVMTALAEVNRCDYCVSFHATAMRNTGASDEEVQTALSFDPEKMGLSEMEQVLFEFAMKANGDTRTAPPGRMSMPASRPAPTIATSSRPSRWSTPATTSISSTGRSISVRTISSRT